MSDKKEAILKELETMKSKELMAKQFFKVRAYRKVIDQINSLPRVTSMEDLENVSGIGVKIKAKIEEILKTGKLKAAERAKESLPKMSIFNELLQINGIGVVKAKELIDQGINSIQDLILAVEKDPNILSSAQKIGLQYHQDLTLKIPKRETQRHLRKISKAVKEVKRSLMIKVVGSYRRGAEESSDIDIILTTKKNTNSNEISEILEKVVDKLKEIGYLVADISSGTKKYMGISKISKKSPARRIDILVTSIEEYPFALVYFTGDFDINVQLRKRANELGYRLNEYGIVSIDKGVGPKLASEREIFNFLGYRYLQPKFRKVNNLKDI